MRRICVFTGSRADYGPLRPVLHRLNEDTNVDLRLLVTGGHLVDNQGLTIEQLQHDGFTAHEQVDMVLASDTSTGVAKSFGLGVIGYADALDRLAPDILVILGDRYEALAVATVAALRLLPIAHIAGGEVTRGSIDDSVRHAITKLAHLHFVSTQDSRRRIVQLGEQPDRVFVVGLPGLDTVRTTTPLPRSELASHLKIEFCEPTLTVTYHPATADPDNSRTGIEGLLDALDDFSEATIVFTGTNIDNGGSEIGALIREYSQQRSRRVTINPSLGQERYLSLVRHSHAVVGNSSSGLIEAPALGTPTVNIGSRQDGRPRAESVIDCAEDSSSISKAILKALSAEYQHKASTTTSPYGNGHSASRIALELTRVPLDNLTTKIFHDVVYGELPQ